MDLIISVLRKWTNEQMCPLCNRLRTGPFMKTPTIFLYEETSGNLLWIE